MYLNVFSVLNQGLIFEKKYVNATQFWWIFRKTKNTWIEVSVAKTVLVEFHWKINVGHIGRNIVRRHIVHQTVCQILKSADQACATQRLLTLLSGFHNTCVLSLQYSLWQPQTGYVQRHWLADALGRYFSQVHVTRLLQVNSSFRRKRLV